MKFFVHSYTDYCGTDGKEVIDAEDEREAEAMAANMAYDNASMYYEVIDEDELEELRTDPDFNDERYITYEEFSYSLEEYDHKLHKDYL